MRIEGVERTTGRRIARAALAFEALLQALQELVQARRDRGELGREAGFVEAHAQALDVDRLRFA